MLTLTVLTYQGRPPDQPMTLSLPTGTATIGRSEDCTWSLPDPVIRLSRLHCEVFEQDGVWWIKDASSNGIHVNGAPDRLELGRARALAQGDRLSMGDYVISVAVSSQNALSRPNAGTSADPFGLGIGLISLGAGDREREPVAAAGAFSAPTPPSRNPAPDFGADSDPFNDPFRFSPFASPVGGEAVADSGNAVSRATAAPIPPSTGSVIPEDWEPFGNHAGPADVKSFPNHVDGQHAFFQSPAMVRDQASVIPAHLDLMKFEGTAAASVPLPATPTPAAPINETPAALWAQSGSPPKAEHRSGDAEDLVAAFLEGAGLGPDATTGENPTEFMRTMGTTFAALVRGLHQVLQARNTLKQEMRIDRTILQAMENNPLKFTLSPDDALSKLVAPPQPGYLTAPEAVSQGLDDIKTHQIATMAAVQAALMGLLHQMDPEILAKRIEKGSLLDAILPSARKARYWELYTKCYSQIARDLEDDFHGVFGREFGRIYNEHTKNST